MRERPTVRVLLLSPAKRLLLFFCLNRVLDDSPPMFWATAGGGIEDGETIEQTARREIREETGILEIEIGPIVWTKEEIVTVSGEPVRFLFSYVLAFAAHERVDLSGCTPEEREELLEARWFSLDEIRASTDPIYPFGLASLLEPLLAGIYPAEPIVLR